MHTLRDLCLHLYFKYSIVLSNLITLLPEYSGYKEIWFSEIFQWTNRTHRVPGYRSRGPGFDSRRYQIFWKAVGLERDPFSLVSTTEEPLRRKSSGSGLENREYSCKDPSSWQRGTLTTKDGTNFADSGGRSVGIVRQRTQATKFSLVLSIRKYYVTFCLTLPSKWNVSEYSPFFSSLQLTKHVSAQFCL
jgi:hypothetical protein